MDSSIPVCFIVVLQHNLEIIKVEPDLDTESFSGSPFYEDPLTDETEDQDPLLIKSAVVKNEVKVNDAHFFVR
jgi:hypothetical protein